MTNQLNHNPIRAVDGDGNPVSGALARFYNVDTVTEQTVYSDSALSAVHAQPLVADSNGVFPQVFTAGTVQTKVNVTDSSGTTLPGYPLNPANSIPLSTSGASAISFSPPAWSSSTTVQAAIEEVYADSLQNVVEDTTPQLGGILDTNGNQVRLSVGAAVASAGTLTLGNDGNTFNITGTTTITGIATKAVGTIVVLRFAGVLTLTHDGTALDLPTKANITTAVADIGVFYEHAAGNWRCISYTRANGKALAKSTFPEFFQSTGQTITSAGALTLAHGLGQAPKLIQAYLKCTTADLNYSVGDEVLVSGGQEAYGSTVSAGVSIVPDATNLNIRFGSNAGAFALLNKTTGTVGTITNGSWDFYARAWA